MTTTPFANRTWLRRIGIALLWIATVLEALGMGLAGFSKFGNMEAWMGMFERWGYPAWFSLVVGGSEMAGAVLLLVPRLASWAAIFLGVVMLGALATVIVNDSSLGVAAPIGNMVGLAIVGTWRWNRRWRPGADATR